MRLINLSWNTKRKEDKFKLDYEEDGITISCEKFEKIR